jgi:hypothetical protein
MHLVTVAQLHLARQGAAAQAPAHRHRGERRQQVQLAVGVLHLHARRHAADQRRRARRRGIADEQRRVGVAVVAALLAAQTSRRAAAARRASEPPRPPAARTECATASRCAPARQQLDAQLGRRRRRRSAASRRSGRCSAPATSCTARAVPPAAGRRGGATGGAARARCRPRALAHDADVAVRRRQQVGAAGAHQQRRVAARRRGIDALRVQQALLGLGQCSECGGDNVNTSVRMKRRPCDSTSNACTAGGSRHTTTSLSTVSLLATSVTRQPRMATLRRGQSSQASCTLPSTSRCSRYGWSPARVFADRQRDERARVGVLWRAPIGLDPQVHVARAADQLQPLARLGARDLHALRARRAGRHRAERLDKVGIGARRLGQQQHCVAVRRKAARLHVDLGAAHRLGVAHQVLLVGLGRRVEPQARLPVGELGLGQPAADVRRDRQLDPRARRDLALGRRPFRRRVGRERLHRWSK